jgi:23S rRNA pseudouridine1911/1915/1917 synthase
MQKKIINYLPVSGSLPENIPDLTTESSPEQPLQILFEDDDLLIADKPAGMLSLEDSTSRRSLISQVKDYLKKSQGSDEKIYCAPIHRLDRPVSGAMLFAKNNESAGKLSEDMKKGRIQKIYFAIVNPAAGSIISEEWKLLEQHYVRRRDRAYIVEPGTPRATAVSLKYRIIQSKGGYSQVLIDLITGKRHQIRVQLSSIGMPVAGDMFYGSGESFKDGIICLHSLSLGFIHPVNRSNVKITAPVPGHISDKIQ